MKILYSINLKSAENDLLGLSSYPIINYTKSDILHGIGASYITLLFDYWEQQIVVVQDGLLSFLFNLQGALVALRDGEKEKSHVFSVEQGFEMSLTLNKEEVNILIFEKTFKVKISHFLNVVNEVGKRACWEIENIYQGIGENQFFKEIQSQFAICN